MRIILCAALAVAMTATVGARAAVSPLEDTRIPISTLIREDLFAGILQHDMGRMAIGEANLERLLVERPNDRAGLMSWKGAALLTRAAYAYEAGNKAQCRSLHKQSQAAFDEAKRLGPMDNSVFAVNGAGPLLFADRLPKEDRAQAWQQAYENYQAMWKGQGQIADKLPSHIRGELIAGVTMTAQRTGRQAEADAALDKMLVLTKGSAYETQALRWKADPKLQASTSLACQNCHDDGRLGAVMSRLPANKG
jgi:tetratricopeptide (TPR) repeat protein